MGPTQIVNRYRVQGRPSQNKDIWRAVDSLEDNRAVIIKHFQLPNSLASDKRRLLALLDDCLSLSHAGLARYLDVLSGDDPSQLHLVSEFIPSEPYLPTIRSLSLEAFLDVLGQFCSALYYLHARNYVHLDLHPGNIRLVRPATPSGRWRLKLIDLPLFPLSVLTKHRDLVTFHPTFSAPEVVEGKPFDHRADLYSLGALLYLALVGEPPPPLWQRDPGTSQLAATDTLQTDLITPVFLGPIVRKLLMQPPEHRFSSSYFVIEDMNTNLKESKLGLAPFEDTAQAIESVPYVSTDAMERLLGAIDTRLVNAHSNQALTVSISGLPGSGKKRLGRMLILYLKLLGWRSLKCHEHPGASCAFYVDGFKPTPIDREFSAPSHYGSGLVIDLCDSSKAPFHDVLLSSQRERRRTLCIFYRVTGFGSAHFDSAMSNSHSSLQVTMSAMTAEESALYIDRALLPNSLDPAFKQELSLTALGLPGILASALLDLVQSGAIRKRGAFWETTLAAPTPSVIPGAALDRLCTALGFFSNDKLNMLDLLALAPYPLAISHMAAVLDLAPSAILGATRELQASGLVRLTEEGVSLPSPTFVVMLRHRWTPEHHQRLASHALRVLASQPSDKRAELNALLAVYSSASNQKQETVRYAFSAAQHFASIHRIHDALMFYRMALDAVSLSEVDQRVLILERITELLEQAGNRKEFNYFVAMLQEALPATSSTERMSLYRLLAKHHHHMGEGQEAIQAARQALEIASRLGAYELQVSCFDLMAHAYLQMGQTSQALRTARDAIRLRVQHQVKASMGGPLNAMAGAFYVEGDYSKALRCTRKVARLSEAPLDLDRFVDANNNLGILYMESGDLRRARRAYRAGLASAVRSGNSKAMSYVLSNRGLCEHYSGHIPQSARDLREALELAKASGTLYGYPNLLLNFAEVFLFRGLLGRAMELIQETVQNVALKKDERNRILAQLQMGQVVHHLGAHADARKILCTILPATSRAGYRTLEVACSIGIANQDIVQGDLESAFSRLEEVTSRLPRQHAVSNLIHRITLGRYYTATNDLATARRAFMLAEALARRAGYRGFAFEAQLALAQNLLGAGDVEEAGRVLRRLVGLNSRIKYRLHEPWLNVALADHAQAVGDLREEQRHLLNARTALMELSYNIGDLTMRTHFLNRADSRELLTRSEKSEDTLYSGFAVVPEQPQAARALESIARINEQLYRRDSLKSTLALIIDETLRLSCAERGIIFLFTPSGREELKVARNVERRSLADARRYTRTALRRIRSGEIIYAADALIDPQFAGVDSITHHRIRSVVCVPLRSRSSIIGALYLDSKRPGLAAGPDLLKSLEIFAQQAAAALEQARRYFHLADENRRLRESVRVGVPKLIGQGSYFAGLKQLIAAAANTDLPVLILGESGTGKELVARAIHYSGKRSTEPFVSVDCGALPENLVESELFGHKRGAFTGADFDKEGLFIAARGGTLLLDEIGNTSPGVQAKLLRAIQEREIRPVGSTRSIPIQARLVTATNRDLRRDACEGRFRQDLLFRLNGLTIEMPSLRDRKGEIPLLVAHFLQKTAGRYGHRIDQISDAALRALTHYDWPGNIRELENCIERAVALARGGTISLADLPETVRSSMTVAWTGKKGEHRLIEEALCRFEGDKTRAAEFIGWNRQKLYRKMAQYNIPSDFGRRNTA